MSVKYEAATGFSGLANFQSTIDSLSSAVNAANKKLEEAKANMEAGDPAKIMDVQLQAQSLAQVFTTLTNLLKNLNDTTSTINRNIT
jgi:hypothetical protein